MKNKKLAFLSLALLGGTLSGCSFTNNQDANTLTMWAGGQWVQHDADNLKKFIEDYNTKHEVKIDLTIKAEFENQIAAAILAGKQPDIVIWDRFNTPAYAKQEYLCDIDAFIERDEIDASDFQEQAWDELSYNGKQYGIPLDLDIWGVYVNMDLIDEQYKSLIKDDWTWEDLKTVAHGVTKRGSSGFQVAGYSAYDLNEHFFKYVVSTGVEFEKDGRLQYNNDEVKAVLNYFRDFGYGDVVNNDTNGKDAFRNGMLAMINQSVYYSSYLKTYAPNINYKFLPQPKYSGADGKNGGVIGGFGMALPQPIERNRTKAYYERKEKAWDVIKSWLCDEETSLEWSRASNTLPALKALYDTDWVEQTEILADAASYVDNYEIRPRVPGFINIQINIYNNIIQKYYKGTYGGTLDDLIRELETETNKIIDRY